MVVSMHIDTPLGTNLVWEEHLMQAADRPYTEITSVGRDKFWPRMEYLHPLNNSTCAVCSCSKNQFLAWTLMYSSEV